MNIESRKEGLFKLGDKLNSFLKQPDFEFLEDVRQSNQWFIPEFVLRSIDGISRFLNSQNIEKWLSSYKIHENKKKNIGIIMAGNIPIVGFHDLLTVVITGHNAVVKTSHQDTILTKWIINKLFKIDPGFKSTISIIDSITDINALIATGSDNSARYFKYYFSNKPAIIRKNRSSIAIINGNENEVDIINLADDIFLYFGLGCRNVSKLFVPKGYKIEGLINSFSKYSFIKEHPGYINNYNQQKAIYSISKAKFHDGEFYIFRESTGFISPISVIYYEEYESIGHLGSRINAISENTQCVISTDYPNSISPGTGQYPELWDYPDNVDSMEFLTNL